MFQVFFEMFVRPYMLVFVALSDWNSVSVGSHWRGQDQPRQAEGSHHRTDGKHCFGVDRTPFDDVKSSGAAVGDSPSPYKGTASSGSNQGRPINAARPGARTSGPRRLRMCRSTNTAGIFRPNLGTGLRHGLLSAYTSRCGRVPAQTRSLGRAIWPKDTRDELVAASDRGPAIRRSLGGGRVTVLKLNLALDASK